MNKELLNNALKIVEEANTRAKQAETPLFVNFSGGKDSSSLLLLARMVTDKVEAIYMTSGLELPGTIEFVQKEADRLNLKLHITDPVRDYMGDLAFWVRKNGYFPACGYAFCSSRLKIRPSRVYLRRLYGHKPMYRLNGVRKSESSRRKKMYKDIPPIRPDGDLAGSFIVQPIQEWSTPDVKEFLEEQNFVVQKQYSSFGVSGCAYCPFYTTTIYHRILAVYPNIYDNIIQLENEVKLPSVSGRVFMRDLVANFNENKDEIIAGLSAISDKKDVKECA